MFEWPTKPVAKLSVRFNLIAGIISAIPDPTGLSQEVLAECSIGGASIVPMGNQGERVAVNNKQIKWCIELKVESILETSGTAYFEYYLWKKPNGDLSQPYSKHLNPGRTSQRISVSSNQVVTVRLYFTDTMEHDVEYYRLRLLAKDNKVSDPRTYADTGYVNFYFTAFWNPILGNFILDYLPITIVYDPPGQDMSASLGQREEFGTTLTCGFTKTEGKTSSKSAGVSVGFQAHSSSERESATTQTTSKSLDMKNFRNTIITADNKTAIGRKYFGPLADIFVIGKGSEFSAEFSNIKQTLAYWFEEMENVIILPAHKLLRPGDDNIANSIPPEVRYELLTLDPFFPRDQLDLFFPSFEPRGVVCYVKEENGVGYNAVYRIYIAPSNMYAYTIDYDFYSEITQRSMFKAEGIAFYVADPDESPPPDHVPLYHLTGFQTTILTTSKDIRERALTYGFEDKKHLGYVIKPDEKESNIKTGYTPLFCAYGGKLSGPSLPQVHEECHFYTIRESEYRKKVGPPPEDLNLACDSSIDPSKNSRAELIGTWYPSAGVDLQYQLGDAIDLKQGESRQLTWSTSFQESFGGGFSLFGLGFTTSSGSGTFKQIGYQSSIETRETFSTSAACHILRNQNADDLRGIQIYYDKIFSTLMFRLIPENPRIIQGSVYSPTGMRQDRMDVGLYQNNRCIAETATSTLGRYGFFLPEPGQYEIRIKGNDPIPVNVDFDSENRIINKDIRDVLRVIDLQEAPIWEIRKLLGEYTINLKILRENILNIIDETDLRSCINMPEDEYEEIKSDFIISFPRTPLTQISLLKSEVLKKLTSLKIFNVGALMESFSKEPTDLAKSLEVPVKDLQHLEKNIETHKETFKGDFANLSLNSIKLFNSDELKRLHSFNIFTIKGYNEKLSLDDDPEKWNYEEITSISKDIKIDSDRLTELHGLMKIKYDEYVKQFPNKPVSQISLISQDTINQLYAKNIFTIQELWRALAEDESIEQLASHIGIEKDTIIEWKGRIKETKPSNLEFRFEEVGSLQLSEKEE